MNSRVYSVFVCVSVCVPAADDSLAGQCKVQEGLPDLKAQSVFERLPVYDEGQLVLLPQRVSQRRAVSYQSRSSGLEERIHS